MEFQRWTYGTYCTILGALLWFPFNIKGLNETHEAKLTPANIYSPGYIFNDYGPNITYDYLVETKYPNHTVMLTMKECEIETDRHGDCSDDTLKIYDGVNDTAYLIDTFCCSVTPLPVWYTSGPFVYLVFTTDASYNFKGFKMEFASFGPTTTTSTATTSTTSTTTTSTTITKTTTTTSSTSTTNTTTTTTTSMPTVQTTISSTLSTQAPHSGQNETHIATVSPEFLYSPGYVDNIPYEPNMTYDYYVETYYPNHTIKLTMDDCAIESDKYGRCFYDLLEIFDGTNDSARLIDSFCCAVTPLPVWTTTGPEVYIRFTTDSNNNDKGFKIEFVTYGPTTTTLTTPASTPSNSSITVISTTSFPTSSRSSVVSTVNSVTTINTPPMSTTILTSTTSSATTAPSTTGGATSSEPGTTQMIPAPSPEIIDDSNSNISIIVGSVLGGLLLFILLVIIIVCLILKSKRPRSSDSNRERNWRRFWIRNGSTKVHPANKNAITVAEVVQTNIFDLDLPTSGTKLSLLSPITPPLSSLLYPSSPIKQPTIAEIFPEEEGPP